MEWTRARPAPQPAMPDFAGDSRRRHPRPHQPSAVQHDPDRLAALGLVLAGDGAAAPRRGRPANVAQVVALAILAQALEVAAQAALLRLAQLQIDLPAARQKDLLLLAGAQSGIDAHRLRRAAPWPSARSAPAASDSADRASPSRSRRAPGVRRGSGCDAGDAGKSRQPVRGRLAQQAPAADRRPGGTRQSPGRGSRWSARSRSRCRARAHWTRSGPRSVVAGAAGAARRAAPPAAPARPRPAWRRPAAHPRSPE